MNKKTVAKKGVTLMELLVVLALLSIVSLSLFTIFRTATESYSKGDARTQAYQNARAALEQMARDVKGAMMDDAIPIDMEGTSTTLFFVSPNENSGDMDLCELGYWIRTSDNTLMRHIDIADKNDSPPLDFDFDTPSRSYEETDVFDRYELALYIPRLELEYYDGTTWTNIWDTATVNTSLPSAVKITIDAGDEKGQETNTFSTVVYLPNAK